VTSIAAAKKLHAAGTIGADVVVCNLTGHGLKQPEAICFAENQFALIAPTLEALRKRMQVTDTTCQEVKRANLSRT
jgi:threonine synthase